MEAGSLNQPLDHRESPILYVLYISFSVMKYTDTLEMSPLSVQNSAFFFPPAANDCLVSQGESLLIPQSPSSQHSLSSRLLAKFLSTTSH